jgi:two-component system cell cycle sensor histidine kinase/response regulator CckA
MNPSSSRTLRLALWCAVIAAGAIVLSIALPDLESGPRTFVSVIAALAAVGACVSLVHLRKSAGGADISGLAPVTEAAEGARIITGPGGAVLYRNAQARDWLRDAHPLAYIESNVARDLGHDADGAEGVARLRHAADHTLAASAEIPLSVGGADPEWHAVSVRPLPLGTGLMLWSAIDVTARRTINDILNQERQDLADFLYFMPTGLYSVDVDGKFRFANQRFADWLGYGPEELNGLSLDDVVAGSQRPQPDGEWQGEVHFKTRGGETVPALVLQSTYDDAGDTRTRTLVIRDGVRRDPNIAPGRIAYERFRSLFNAAPVAIAIADHDGVIVDCNGAFEKLANQNRAVLIGGSLIERLTPDDRRAFNAELSRVLSGESTGTHLDVSILGETTAQTSVFVGPLAAASEAGQSVGEIEGVVAHFIDVTEQKNLEVQFAQAQKMQAMGQLAGGVAHDFNNLLTAMIGFCDLLLQRHAAGDPSFADIMQIKQNSNRAANLVRQLLAFSRKQPLQPKDLNITDALMEMSHLLTRLIGESIEFKLLHGRDLGVVRVDPGQFDQMIINLAVNARDAMPGGGTLSIITGTETFETPTKVGAEQVPAGRYVRISVSDTGKGIPPENLGRIFEPFFSTKKEIPGAGTGLGLATVYGIVRQTGGFIQVDSAMGKGSNFTIYLPRVEETEAMVAASKARAAGAAERASGHDSEAALAVADLGGHGNILLVEDEDAVRVFAARALKNKGYKVLEARTGEQALDILRDTPAVDLMITDMMMPGMDGGTLARLIRVERPEIRIIVISGYSEEVARGDIVDTADFHFLPKPFSLGQLASKVKDVLTGA